MLVLSRVPALVKVANAAMAMVCLMTQAAWVKSRSALTLPPMRPVKCAQRGV